MLILNPMEPWPGELALGAAARHDISVLARVVDYGGLFWDDVTPARAPQRPDHRAFRPAGWIEAGRERLERMRPIADRHGLTMLQLAAQWDLAHGPVRSVAPTLIQEAGPGARARRGQAGRAGGHAGGGRPVRRGGRRAPGDRRQRRHHGPEGRRPRPRRAGLADRWTIDDELRAVAAPLGHRARARARPERRLTGGPGAGVGAGRTGGLGQRSDAGAPARGARLGRRAAGNDPTHLLPSSSARSPRRAGVVPGADARSTRSGPPVGGAAAPGADHGRPWWRSCAWWTPTSPRSPLACSAPCTRRAGRASSIASSSGTRRARPSTSRCCWPTADPLAEAGAGEPPPLARPRLLDYGPAPMPRARLLLPLVAALAVAVTPGAASAAGRCGTHPWCDTSLSPDRRADLLLGALTPTERLGLLGGDDINGALGGPHAHTGTQDGVPRLDVPTVLYTDGPQGPRQGGRPGCRPRSASRRRGARPRPAPTAPSWGARRATRATTSSSARRQPPAHAAQRAHLRELRRGPAPDRPDGGRVDPGRPGAGRHRRRQALRGQQPGGLQPAGEHEPPRPAARAARDRGLALQGRRPRRRAHPARARAARLRGGGARRRRRHGDVLLQQARRDVRVREPRGCSPASSARGASRGSCWPTTARSTASAPSIRAGLAFEPWPGHDADRGPGRRRPSTRASSTQAQADGAVRRMLRTFFAFGVFDRPAFRDDDAQIPRRAHARTARRLAEQATTLLVNRRGTLPLRAPGAAVDRGARRGERSLRHRRRVGQRHAVQRHDAPVGRPGARRAARARARLRRDRPGARRCGWPGARTSPSWPRPTTSPRASTAPA